MGKQQQGKAPALTSEEKQQIARMCSRTWDYIGSDALRALEEAGEKPEMPRSHVIEVVLDADRLEFQHRKPEEQALLKRFRALDYEQQKRIARLAFPFGRYGY